ncbi:amidohydrolase family protein [Shewanella maritima]|uniref:amidohydrolase family protein n=1 Tax=Shewanella maritima TaxID=2520507 RepID=UPI003736E418
MKKLPKSLLTLSMMLAIAPTYVAAQSIAIINAKVHTATEQGVLNNATVVFNEGKIVAINPAQVNADKTIDANGKVLTPGFISTMNAVGLVEVSQAKATRDTVDEAIDMTFDASLAFNPKTTAIPLARKGGLTTSVITANGGETIYAGQTFTAKMTGEWDSVVSTHGALYVELGMSHDGSRGISMQTLIRELEDAHKKLTAKEDDEEEPSRESLIINAVLAGEKTLIVYADRASDILHLLELKKQYDIDLVLIDAADAVIVAEQIAQAKVPVVMDSMRNLPESFDSLHNHLSNAAKLTQAGVQVVLTTSGGAHTVYGLRYAVGNAVANGMDYNAAMKSVTSNAASVFKIDAGSIAVGKPADIVLWNGDPFEYSTQVDTMWIDGEQQSTESRHDKLRDRYMKQSTMPAAYTR